jgi:hypothetical protein
VTREKLVRGALLAIGLVMYCASSVAQELEPRAYANAPVGLNFLVVAYGFTEGGVVPDPTVPLTNAQIRIHGFALAYARSLRIARRSAKVDVVLPYASLSGTADVAGEPREREVSGFGDPRLRLSINLLGAPALTLQDMRGYRQNLIVGASLHVWVPAGQYDTDRLVNIGTHRWAVKPELGMSKAFGLWTLELSGGATFFQDNDAFLGGTRAQEPVYSIQTGVIRSLPSGIWMSLSGTWYAGGRTEVDGVRKNDLQESSRVGLTVSVPIGRHNSIKFYAHTGISVRTGSDFDVGGLAWQYRWGGGL